MKKKIIYSFLISVLILIISVFAMYNYSVEGERFSYENKSINVRKGENLYKILDNLGVKRSFFVKLFIRTNSDEFKRIEEGTYIFQGYYSLKTIIEKLQNSRESFISVTIPEGFSTNQIKERLEQNGVISKEDFDKALLEVKDFYYYTPEGNFDGYLFPDTYFFVKDENGASVVNKFLRRFLQKFPPEEYPDKNYFYERLKLASIIEKEAGNKDEMPIVSSVFQNRLDKGMKLQSCATVAYLFNFEKDFIYYKDLEIDSPYNTYKYKGLPPSPISNPGEASIKASFNPAKTEYFYFVLGNNGKHNFSRTYSEHIAVQNKEKRGNADDGKIRVKR